MNTTQSRPIPERLGKAITIAMVKWKCRLTLGAASCAFHAPQILILAGRPGVGKTTAVNDISAVTNAALHRLSASTIGGPLEGQAVVALRESYLRAGRDESAWLSVLSLEDFDLSDGSVDENTSGTVNGPMMNELLMSKDTDPHRVEISYHDKPPTITPVPNPPLIIMTANNPAKIFEPLRCPGRAQIIEWELTPGELAEVLASMYPALRPAEAHKLVAAFPTETIRFFEQLGVRAIDSTLEQVIALTDPAALAATNFKDLAAHIEKARSRLTFKHLLEAGRRLAAEHGEKSYLKPKKAA